MLDGYPYVYIFLCSGSCCGCELMAVRGTLASLPELLRFSQKQVFFLVLYNSSQRVAASFFVVMCVTLPSQHYPLLIQRCPVMC